MKAPEQAADDYLQEYEGKAPRPDPSKLPEGCAFYPRCDYACEACQTKRPEKRWLTDTHYVECHLYNDAADGDKSRL